MVKKRPIRKRPINKANRITISHQKALAGRPSPKISGDR
jgi:hypothetical protein